MFLINGLILTITLGLILYGYIGMEVWAVFTGLILFFISIFLGIASEY